MDDEGIFGEEIYTLNFTKAIALDLLTDYKVIILAVRKENLSGVTNSVNKKISRLEAEGTKLDKKLINNEFVCKIIGTHKGLAKKDLIALDDENKKDYNLQNKNDTTPSQRAISFCKSINTSKNIKDSFETIMECYDEELKKKSFKNLTISIDHIDGTMNCKVRLEKLEELNAFKPNTCKVLSNARCLSEGVDVPALDSIVFFDGKSAMVDIIQAVGRVMRKAKHKKRGYIILPIALEESEIQNLDEAVNNTNFKNIWKVIKALRSHDPSLVDEATFREKIKIFGSDDNNEANQDDEELQKDKIDKTEQDPKQAQKTLFDAILLQDLANAVYNVMPTKLGDRNYWENFTKKTGNIARTLNNRLKDIFEKNPEFFHGFKDAQNVVINTGVGNGKNFSALVSDCISDKNLISPNQAYPLYYYDGLGNRHYAISGYALNLFRKHYKDNSIAEEEIFYYIYAILHHKGYLEKYKNSLTKEDPRIALSEDFKELFILGKELAKLHLNYESGEMHASVEYKTLMNAEEEGYYDVETMKKIGDRILYNKNIAITKIPKKAFDYVVNGKSAIDWVIERYKKTTDDSLIENNPNDYAGGKYVFELLCRVIKLSEKSVDLIEKISEKRFE
ncbi:type ISP restriction/modification enzyme [Helicobacter pylori]|uniref:type ISP restriction/modification enzyme n=1 Tax=Helicobacter pylori TaxID=210 RepID=UPI001E51C18D|nr:type ISP restriction/modification enzyme [Helicobacter pylori]